MKKVNIAVVGATGMVGNMFVKVLEERQLPIDNIYFFASSRSKGKIIKFNNKDIEVLELTEDSFNQDIRKIDIALFSAGGDTSRKYAPIAKQNGVIVIDNSSAFRMKEDVPLCVPEVNSHVLHNHNGIIANPNCSTIQAMVPLKPLHDKFKIKRIIYSTYQAVSGGGSAAYNDLLNGVKGEEPKKFNHPIAFNVIPQIDVFTDDGYTFEEIKMINETKKILEDDSLKITATAVRVPVLNGHSESINVEFFNDFEMNDIFDTLNNAKGVIMKDDTKNNVFPMPSDLVDCDEVLVGRVRRDLSADNAINMWVVADNIRKGAATNAIQIAEYLISNVL